MELLKSEKDLQLTLALTDADLLEVVQKSFSRPQRLSYAGVKGALKSDVLARYSANDGTLTFTGLLHQRFPIDFILTPGSRSYENFLLFLLRELKGLSERTKSERRELLAGDALIAIRDLTESLERKVLHFDGEMRGSVADVNEIVEIFRSDLQAYKRAARGLDADSKAGTLTPPIVLKRRLRGASQFPGRALINLPSRERKFRVLSSDPTVSQFISGFLSLEIEDLQEKLPPAVPQDSIDRSDWLLKHSLAVTGTPSVNVSSANAMVILPLSVDPEIADRTEVFLHWGLVGDGSRGTLPPWVDEEVDDDECERDAEGKITVRKQLVPGRVGRFAVTAYARVRGSSEKVWLSSGGLTDLNFEVYRPCGFEDMQQLCRDMVRSMDVKRRMVHGLHDLKSFARTVIQLQKDPKARGLGKLLCDATKENAQLRSLVSEYYRDAVLSFGRREGGLRDSSVRDSGIPKTALKRVITLLQNIGIGEVVFVAPEGPHAIAGGLAQVVVGLIKSLSRCGVSCTVITPLYEQSQGSKHQSAEEILAQGVVLLGQRVPVTYQGEVKIPMGCTKYAGSSQVKEAPILVRARVYVAEHEGVRLVFLRNKRFAERLYAPGESDAQLRRSIFLSRGSLEVMRNPGFNISPHLVITNDWLSALVPVFLRADPRYSEDAIFRDVETCHVLHNCGRAYQGRLYANQFGEDLWPLLGLGDDHYFGLADPDERSLLNLTAGAAFHSSKALVAVSKPYATQLLTVKGGEGLHNIFEGNRKAFFGISNGVDLAALRTVFWQLGETARKELGLKPLLRRKLSHHSLMKRMEEYKFAMKSIVQRKYGLTEDSDALLLSLVGRLAEQKGIQLLTGCAEGDELSVMESILKSHSRVQFIIAGPPAPGDPAVPELQALVEELTQRYPGRVKGVFNFIPHEEALEITQSSDFFLMPSRYEPGGITQLEALAAGTLVIARNVGGLKATLVDYASSRGDGDSFLFNEFSSTAFKEIICRAIATISDDATHRRLITQAALAENDWSHRAPKYLSILQHAAGVFDGSYTFEHLAARRHLLSSLRAG